MKIKPYYTAIATGLLLGLSFPPFPFPLLAFIAFLPFFYSLDKGKLPRNAFLYIYALYFVYNLLTLWWVGSWQPKADPFLMISGVGIILLHPFFFIIPTYILLYLKRKFPVNFIWFFPFAQAFGDWFHSLGEFSFPWINLGFSQIYNRSWIQFIDITGVFGASFAVALVNVLIYKIVMAVLARRKEKNGARAADTILYPAIALTLLVVGPYTYGFMKNYEYSYQVQSKKRENISVAVVQPNIDPWEKWRGSVEGQVLLYQKLQDSLMRARGRFDLAVWCETAVPFMNISLNTGKDVSYLQSRVDQRKISLMTGMAYYQFFENGEKKHPDARQMGADTSVYYTAWNGAMMLNPAPYSDKIPQLYKKMKLTPFSERIPYQEYVPFLKKWINWGVGISSWSKGEKQHILKLENGPAMTKVASIICIESVYPNFVRKFAMHDAQLYTIITNDAWYDHTFGPRQHYLIGCLRAIESRRFIARAANSGISGFIAANGESIYEAPQYEQAAIAMSLPLIEEKTLYSRYGDWIGWLSLIVSAAAIIWGAVRKRG